MASERLYELGFRYREAKLWRDLLEINVFAVRFSDGQTGYCYVGGRIWPEKCLSVFVGETEFATYQDMVRRSRSLFDADDLMTSKLLFLLANKEDVPERQHTEARQYAKTHGLRFSGSNSFPCFLKKKPLYMAWPVDDERTELYLAEALEAALHVADCIQGGKRPHELGFSEPYHEKMDIPLLTPGKEGYEWSIIAQPDMKANLPKRPSPKWRNELETQRIRKLPKRGAEWEVFITVMPDPVQDEPDEIPVFPNLVVASDSDSEEILFAGLVMDGLKNSEEFAEMLAGQIRELGECPEIIAVQDRDAKRLLNSFCKAVGITLSVRDWLPVAKGAALEIIEQCTDEPDLDSGFLFDI